jgi:hypothetical protein
MEDLRLQAVAARVAAWHNRHPLARRITAAQVHSIGYVALPFSAGAPWRARKRKVRRKAKRRGSRRHPPRPRPRPRRRSPSCRRLSPKT